jgi:hypothetical protein
MTWCRQGRYFYRSRREGQRVVSEYRGCGDAGALLAEIDNRAAHAREAARRALREEADQTRQLDAALADIYLAADQAASAALHGAGYHLHKRSWRRKRPPHEV